MQFTISLNTFIKNIQFKCIKARGNNNYIQEITFKKITIMCLKSIEVDCHTNWNKYMEYIIFHVFGTKSLQVDSYNRLRSDLQERDYEKFFRFNFGLKINNLVIIR